MSESKASAKLMGMNAFTGGLMAGLLGLHYYRGDSATQAGVTLFLLAFNVYMAYRNYKHVS